MTAFAGGGQPLSSNINGFGLRGSEVAASIDFTPAERRKNGFTLAETLITLVILGVVAAITVPTLMKRQVEAQNRTKVKKAMSTYDTAVSKMVIENGNIKSIAELQRLNTENCTDTSIYFKATEKDPANGCVFKAADGLWWDITKIERPIISFNKLDLTEANAGNLDNKTTFYLVSGFDANGSLRVDDVGVAQNINIPAEYKNAVEKLYGFVNDQKNNSTTDDGPYSAYKKPCVDGEDMIACTAVYWGELGNFYDKSTYIYDEKGRLVYEDSIYGSCENGKESCKFGDPETFFRYVYYDDGSYKTIITSSGNVSVSKVDKEGNYVGEKHDCDENGENCEECIIDLPGADCDSI